MRALKSYIGDRQGLVFITRFGKPVDLRQLAITFAQAGQQANIPFKVTPHVLRASTVTYLKQQGFSDSDIMRVTGHASSELVYAYDKNSRADNASKKVSLVN
jgi:integrase